jgi:subtilase family serine protease
MPRNRGIFCFCTVAVICLLGLSFASRAQAQVSSQARSPITGSIDESKLVRLGGNTRPEVTPANDRGIVANNFEMDHMLLQLRRTPEEEQALRDFIDELHNPQSPNFHQWLTAEQFGERFGLAQQDIGAITRWLESYGFRINVVYPSRILIDFSGTAEQVRQAFHTEIHHIEVQGVSHVANVRDPQIPAALAPVVVGIVSLHDFRPHPMVKLRGQYTFSDILGDTYYAVVPGDLATIYNFNPIFASGISGQGQTIVLVEDTDLYSTADWSTFRSTFGLSGYSASLSQVHPGPNNCSDPGVNADDVEAILDAEYASAAAPSAAIQIATCSDTSSTFGGLIAIQNLINASGTPPPIVSISYGECEAVNGAAANTAYNSTYQQAVAEGVSVYVAAGDSGGAGCDENQAAAASGIAVNGFASTPYNVAVGGTDFSDTYSGTNSTYWNSGNTSNYASALSYIPEIPWNDSCTGTLLASYEGYSVYGANSFCNAASGLLAALTGTLTTAAGGGGPSGCATGVPSISGVVSGSCAGWAKPSWQLVFGNPNDGVRDTPDVSLFAANGLWSHYYIFCYSDIANGGTACTGSPSGWTGAGGTSFASPIMAGVQALVNQNTGSRQGNPNPTLYSLANTEYGAAGNSSCNSNLGNSVATSCTFYDLTLGDMVVDCTGNYNCYDSSAGYGALSASSSAYQAAYGSGAGWDFGSGMGSVNVANLVKSWPGSSSNPDFSLSASPTSVTITQGGPGGTSTITVNPLNNFNGSVSLSVTAGLPAGVTPSFSTDSTMSTSVLTLTASGAASTGTFTLTITGTAGSLTHTTAVTLTVNAAPQPNFTLSASPSSLSIARGASKPTTITVTPLNGFNSSVSLSATGVPKGLTASFSVTSTTTTSTLTLAASSTASVGSFNVTIKGVSGSVSHTTTISLKITRH